MELLSANTLISRKHCSGYYVQRFFALLHSILPRPARHLVDVLTDAEHAFLPIEAFETFKTYLSGDGLEIGGPSPVFSGRSILPVYLMARSLDNCNFSSTTVFQPGTRGEGRTFRFAKNKVGLQFICEATDLRPIANEKYDFVISSHTIEHISNPLKALIEWKRVIKRGGVLLLVVPHKERTFDHKRPVTKVEHILEDYHNEIDENDLTDLPEILRSHDLSMDPMTRNLHDFLLRSRNNVRYRILHHHVFDTDLAVQMVRIAGFKVLFVGTHRFHIILVCQKTDDAIKFGEHGAKSSAANAASH
jgi:SAM-dependent methyltransferase